MLILYSERKGNDLLLSVRCEQACLKLRRAQTMPVQTIQILYVLSLILAETKNLTESPAQNSRQIRVQILPSFPAKYSQRPA